MYTSVIIGKERKGYSDIIKPGNENEIFLMDKTGVGLTSRGKDTARFTCTRSTTSE